jgi:transposase, IS5 family
MKGPRLGRPPTDKTLYNRQKQQERMEAGQRNEVEAKFGEAISVQLVFLMMNLKKSVRSLLVFIRTVIHLPHFYWTRSLAWVGQ